MVVVSNKLVDSSGASSNLARTSRQDIEARMLKMSPAPEFGNKATEACLVRWANHYLQRRNLEMRDASVEFSRYLPDLVEILTGKSLVDLKPNDTTRADRLSNVTTALSLLRTCTEHSNIAATIRISASDLVDGEKGAIIHILLLLAQVFELQPIEEGGETGGAALLSWCRRMVAPYRGAAVTDLCHSWRTGLSLCALLHRLRPDVVDYDACLLRDAAVNVELGLHMASIYLAAPMLLTTEDLLAPRVDHRTVAIYLATLWHAAAAYTAPPSSPRPAWPSLADADAAAAAAAACPPDGDGDSEPSAQHPGPRPAPPGDGLTDAGGSAGASDSATTHGGGDSRQAALSSGAAAGRGEELPSARAVTSQAHVRRRLEARSPERHGEAAAVAGSDGGQDALRPADALPAAPQPTAPPRRAAVAATAAGVPAAAAAAATWDSVVGEPR